MYGRAWKPTVVEEVIKKIGCLLIIHKDNGASRWHREQEIEETIALLRLVDEKDLKNCKLLLAKPERTLLPSG